MSVYDKAEGVYVIISNFKTDEISTIMGPMSGRKADKVENGVLMRIDVDAGWSVKVKTKLTPAEKTFLERKKAKEKDPLALITPTDPDDARELIHGPDW